MKNPSSKPTVISSNEPKPLNDVALLARYIEPGDKFGERLHYGGGSLGSGVVLTSCRETGIVYVERTSGRFKGHQFMEYANAECFNEIIARRQRLEQQEKANMAEAEDSDELPSCAPGT